MRFRPLFGKDHRHFRLEDSRLFACDFFQRVAKKILVVIYGKEYWDKVLNMQAMAEAGTISPEDLELFKLVNSPDEGFEYLRDALTKFHLGGLPKEGLPEIAKTRP